MSGIGDEIPEALGAHFCGGREDLPETWDILDELIDHGRLPRPTLWLWDIPEPNAMATGDAQDRASVTVTSGLLDLLDGPELRAVLAHEVGHIAAGDVAAGTELAYRAARQVGAVGAGAAAAGLAASFTEGIGDDWVAAIAGAVLAAGAMVKAQRQIAAFSRSRELAADAYAAAAGGSPRALASALEKLEAKAVTHPHVPGWARLLLTVDADPEASHPPTALRVESLSRSAAVAGLTKTCGRCRFAEHRSAARCRRCGSELPDLTCPGCGSFMDLEARFCGSCGTPAARFPCRRCGEQVQRGQGFCGSCGQPQDAGTTAVPLAQQRGSELQAGEPVTMSRAEQRQLDGRFGDFLNDGEAVLEAADEVEWRIDGGWGSGTVVITNLRVVMVSSGWRTDSIQAVLERRQLRSAQVEERALSARLHLTTADGGTVRVDKIKETDVAYALAARLHDLLP